MTKRNGIGSKINGAWNGTYGRSRDLFEQLIPAPQTQRRVNRQLAALLELLAYVGFLGFGRIFAGDINGGIRAMIMWWFISFGSSIVIGLIGILGFILAIPTIGLSLLMAAIVALPILWSWLSIPIRSAIKLFQDIPE
jgi:hypothetical protein